MAMQTLKKNMQIELKIDAMSAEGSGIGRYEGQAVFVANTAVGDLVIAHIIKAAKSYAVGKAIQILEPSPHRIAADCPASGRCGGCAYRHISYEEELRIKWNRVNDAFHRIGKLDLTPLPIVAAEETTRYRNKAQYPVHIQDDAVQFGFYASRSHRLVPCDDCPLQPEEFQAGLEAFRKWIVLAGITSYDETVHSGLLRHVYFRKAFGTGQIMACAVVNGSKIPFEKELVSFLREALPGLRSVVLNCNREKTNVILGKHTKTLWGSPFITDHLLGLQVNLSPNSFYQVNYCQTQQLYTIAKEFAGLTGTQTLLDLYCGAGTIGLTMADKAKAVIGIEIIPQAVENAKQNAAQNQIKNASFICTDAAQGAQELKYAGIRPEVVILDPPRKGCGKDLIHTVAQIAPDRVVYVSCDPATLARDLAEFKILGYETVKAVPVDLFPRTVHVESIALLQRKG